MKGEAPKEFFLIKIDYQQQKLFYPIWQYAGEKMLCLATFLSVRR